jgi:hypothetical protein
MRRCDLLVMDGRIDGWVDGWRCEDVHERVVQFLGLENSGSLTTVPVLIVQGSTTRLLHLICGEW